jgi:hypothetical protein
MVQIGSLQKTPQSDSDCNDQKSITYDDVISHVGSNIGIPTDSVKILEADNKTVTLGMFLTALADNCLFFLKYLLCV